MACLKPDLRFKHAIFVVYSDLWACLNKRLHFKHAFFEGVYVKPACLNAALKFKHAGLADNFRNRHVKKLFFVLNMPFLKEVIKYLHV